MCYLNKSTKKSIHQVLERHRDAQNFDTVIARIARKKWSVLVRFVDARDERAQVEVANLVILLGRRRVNQADGLTEELVCFCDDSQGVDEFVLSDQLGGFVEGANLKLVHPMAHAAFATIAGTQQSGCEIKMGTGNLLTRC